MIKVERSNPLSTSAAGAPNTGINTDSRNAPLATARTRMPAQITNAFKATAVSIDCSFSAYNIIIELARAEIYRLVPSKQTTPTGYLLRICFP
jgi:hypothetical protein